ncbi:TIGR04282 family arsenosugar biosynthesis glycosyltransferase [Flavobacterium hiemivividum]|uniref:Glycosyltransferase n=1 Tax=Flavobacterium hiemivividum TaxID=2541734 RepID=A0A4R5D035_9FLAO|nr:TIGR04282 family arsenosugar biosynthesis glycosyltransferase [Flavobacterium hiemivividum]TDE03585.1 glycosyltransferase [Flavobacterium hiemivividum]
MKTDALIIFTRNPEIGKVKTRLAKIIGDEKALTVYNDLLLHTRNETQAIDCDKFVFYDTNIIEEDIWSLEFYQKKLQSEGDLGQRMYQAFESLFKMGYQNCIIVGSDLFDLKSIIIETAFKKLLNHDVVIGPAEDGGYYLLGLKKGNPAVFKNKDWGTDSVFAATMSDFKHQKVGVLDILNDIDTFEDLEKSQYNIAALNLL